MGANFVSLSFKGELTRNQVQKAFDEAVAQSRHESGHSYSGEIGMATGLKFVNQTFNTEDEAYEWLEQNCVKWESALCVTAGVKDPKWYIGAWCAS